MLAVASLFCWTRLAGADEAAQAEIFRQQIEPVLKARCYSCHSAEATEVQGGLRLDSKMALRKGGDSGAVVVPGKSTESLLIQAIRHEGALAMPPGKERLSEEIIRRFAQWIDAGAIDPRDEQFGAVTDKNSSAHAHWAFQPIRKPASPPVTDDTEVRTPIDRFIIAKLAEKRWNLAPSADRIDLIRRATFDLTGLPPNLEEIDAFLADSRPDAWERVVDRLLASPHYGERAGQHWLDVVRFAESEGYEYDRHIPDAWRFRDYVIDSLNADKPFDRFIFEQIAGDEIEPVQPEFQTASIFHRLGPVRRNAGNTEIALSRNEVLTERTDIIGAAFLGLTIGCARCHNHKLEPVSQRDYYQLQAYFAATEEDNILLASAAEAADWNDRAQKHKDQLQQLKMKVREAQGAERDRLVRQVEELEDRTPAPLPTIPATRNDFEKRTPIHILKRGVWEQKGELVAPRPPEILLTPDFPEIAAEERRPRSRLAAWLTAPQNPLTARVVANRIWQQHFGTGLVATVNDFGLKGERPSHPVLLDWLAATLVENGWRIKSLHREILLSVVYCQSSHRSEVADQIAADPRNRLLWRFNRRRLSAEEVRDSMLAAAGRLNPKAHGPSVIVPVDPELVALLYKPSQWEVTADAREYDRRSIYLIAKRNLRLPFFESLDAPTLQTSCGRRDTSTHPPQALELLNGALSNELARSFAERLERECGSDRGQAIERGFQWGLGRLPNVEERRFAEVFLQGQPLSEFCLALFNLNGFLYVP